MAEDGAISACYSLQETTSSNYAVRTRLNVRDSDGTLILNVGRLEGGTALTAQLAGTLNKPVLIIDLDQPLDKTQVEDWINTHNINILNVAGPRENKQPGIYQKAYSCIELLLKR